uniref:Uncharacterized protein n=1 Tax=Lactuca sativa TaxID=4236 RepID=A0A9R1UZD2_LACSA|nr:hypothetical protein LSAT_V11C700385480 [Lactuca sativa]
MISQRQSIEKVKAYEQSGISFNGEIREDVKRPFLDGREIDLVLDKYLTASSLTQTNGILGREKCSQGSPSVAVGKEMLNFGLK